jgi:hypothetical protein
MPPSGHTGIEGSHKEQCDGPRKRGVYQVDLGFHRFGPHSGHPVTFLVVPGWGLLAAGTGMTYCPCHQ